MLAVPLVSEERVLGVIVIRRSEARPFTAGQIAALESFADQAAIAIGHARLFQEVTEALERERATGAILRVIASSPTTVDPVFDAILDSALRLCASPVGNLFLFDGEAFRLVAHRGMRRRLRRGVASAAAALARIPGLARAVAERRPVQILDMMADRAYEERDRIRIQAVELLGARTALFVPMLKDGTPIGVIVIWRREVRAFSESQIQLLSTFADQAVIALENVRLFTGARGPQPRADRGARAADGDRRDPGGDQRVADRRAAGLRHDRAERGAAVRRALRHGHRGRRRVLPPGAPSHASPESARTVHRHGRAPGWTPWPGRRPGDPGARRSCT